eukprot:6175931-Pleurochrysis_carterae.AAC.2
MKTGGVEGLYEICHTFMMRTHIVRTCYAYAGTLSIRTSAICQARNIALGNTAAAQHTTCAQCIMREHTHGNSTHLARIAEAHAHALLARAPCAHGSTHRA